MAYESNYELPNSIKMGLPERAQSIYRSTFNNCFSVSYFQQDTLCINKEQTQLAHKIAWNAVKQKYRRQGNFWVEK